MTTTIGNRTSRFWHRIRHVWGELDYAQRRLFEIQTGVRAD